jgi:hypothetical protein
VNMMRRPAKAILSRTIWPRNNRQKRRVDTHGTRSSQRQAKSLTISSKDKAGSMRMQRKRSQRSKKKFVLLSHLQKR